jgi:hypothetical protein
MGPQLSDGITSDDWVPPELPYESDLGKRFYEKVQAAAVRERGLVDVIF